MNVKKLINVPRILFPVGTEVLIKGKIVGLNVLDDRFVENVVKLAYGEQIIAPNDAIYVKDEPETGYADEAPRYLKNILARLRELPEHDREVWLKAIMVEREKVKVPQFVADWIEEARKTCKDIADFFDFDFTNEEVGKWFMQEQAFDLVARAWLDGYEVEEEKRYLVKVKGMSEENTYLTFRFGHTWMLSNFEECEEFRLHHTRKELEEAGFGWVFSCEGIEIEEVERCRK